MESTKQESITTIPIICCIFKTDYTAALSGFTRDIYLCQMYGKIDPKATYMNGDLVFQLDIDQERTEKQRLDPNRFNKEEG